MTTILLILIYVVYIGLGVPDSLFGTAWPAIYEEFSMPISAANAVTLLISGGTVISSLVSSRLIHRFGTEVVTAFCTSLTAVALLGFSCSGNFGFLCLFAIPLGLGAGAIDVALNNYVALHYNATHMSFLHCFYGIGVTISPYLMSLGIRSGNWRNGYRFAFAVQAVISVVSIVSLPVWRRVGGDEVEEEKRPKVLSLWELAKMPAVRATWLMFIFSCAIEHTCGIWGSSFLVKSKGLSAEMAAKMLIFYYVGLAFGRFLSGVVAKKLTSWNIIYISFGVLGAAVVCLLLPVSFVGVACAGLFLAGLGNGPMYPNLTYLTPIHFGGEISQSVIGSQMAFSYLGIMLMPTIFGFCAQIFGTGVFPHYVTGLFAAFLISMFLLKKSLKKEA